MLKTFKLIFSCILRWIESSDTIYLKIFFWNIINVFTVTFGQFNKSLLKKSINFFQKCWTIMYSLFKEFQQNVI